MSAIHITVGYHEDFSGVIANLEMWNRWFEECADQIVKAQTVQDIFDAKKTNRTAILFGLQNPLAIGADLRRIETLYQLGIRFCQLTYNQQSLLGAGCFEPRDSGLTAFGKEALLEMNSLGMIADLSHAGHQTTLDAIATSTRPVSVTHANPYDWHAAPRNLKQDVLDALFEANGMLGFSLYPHHLQSGSDCTLSQFGAMVGEMVDRYGDRRFGIGSDLCQDQPDSVVNWMRNGHWRKVPGPPAVFPQQPEWFRNNLDFPGLAIGLTDAGVSQDAADRVLGQNWIDFMQAGFEKS